MSARTRTSAAVIVAAFALGGCGEAEDSPAPTQRPGVEEEDSVVEETTGSEPAPSESSVAQEDAETVTREEWLAMGWYGEGDPPEPEHVVREITPEEHTTVMVECLNERGFPAIIAADGGMSLTTEADQAQAAAEANYQCRAQYPQEPKYYQPYNDTQLRAWYAHLAGPLTECLTGLGYDVEPPPSEETWIAGFGVTEGLWQPYDVVPIARYEEIAAACPLMPENFYDLATVPD